ncbi:glycoside hydrolase family 5 protein [Periweissella cryptocerci]|nr:glycoside hydrolase family 5 protein [Periweissella cryptocerci]
MKFKKLIIVGLTAMLIGGVAITSLATQQVTTVEAQAKPKSDWLHTKGNKIVDGRNKTVRLTGLNWFGYETSANTFHGLWQVSMKKSVAAIANHGFNVIRVPMSVALVDNWRIGKASRDTPNINYAANPELQGLNNQQIFNTFLKYAKQNGVKVIIDIHSPSKDGYQSDTWYDDNYSTTKWLNALSYLAKAYKKNDTVIGYDLKNEPHGQAKWDTSKAQNNWRYAATRGAKAVLKKNPHALVFIEGIEQYNGDYSWWGANLQGVKKAPIKLAAKQQKQVVYSSHDYGPIVYQQPWLQGNFKKSVKAYWNKNWLFIHKEKIAPIFIGEWGGYAKNHTGNNLKWLKYLRSEIKQDKLSFTYWCFNPDSGDTGGLVNDNWTTWNGSYKFVKSALWQTKQHKFIGLDGQVKLGTHGVERP